MPAVAKQSTAVSVFVWMADSADGKTGKTGLTLAITLCKNNQTSFSSISPTVTEIGNGTYRVDLTSSHTSVLGPTALRATAAGADPADCPDIVTVVGYDPYDSVRMGQTALPNAAAEAAGGLFTRGTGAGQINQDANGRIDVNGKAWAGGAIPAPNVTGVPLTDQKYSLGTILATPTVAGIPKVEDATLQARLTTTRAGYLDNLNVGGLVAASSEVTSIQNNTRCVRVVPDTLAIPTTGTRTYRIELMLYDEVGNMEAPDSAPTVALVNQAGTDRSSRLDSTTMALVSTGRYRCIYTSTAGDTQEELVWAFSVVEGGATRIYGNASNVGASASGGSGSGTGDTTGTAIWDKNEPTARKRRVDLIVRKDDGTLADHSVDFIALGIVYLSLANSTDMTTPLGTMTNKRIPISAPTFSFTADSTTDQVAHTAHGLQTGDGPLFVNVSGGTLAAPLAAATPYYFIWVDADHGKLATSLANAYAGTAINLTTNGTGTQSFVLNLSFQCTRGVDGLFTYEATQAETNRDDNEILLLVDGTNYSLTNNAGGRASIVMNPNDGWDGDAGDGISRNSCLLAVARDALAPINKSGADLRDYVVRDINDTKDSHHGTITAAGRSGTGINDPSLT